MQLKRFKWLPSISRQDFFALAILFLAFLFWTSSLHIKYYYLCYHDYDFAIYAQVMWSLVNGSCYSSIMGMNFLGNHANFIAFLIVPIYAVFQHPMTLVMLKIISFLAGAYLLYLIAKKDLPYFISISVMVLYLIYPVNIFMLQRDVDFESLNIVFLFLLYIFFRDKKLVPFYLTAGLLMLIKENMPFIVMAFGISGLIDRDRNRWRWGFIPIVAAALYTAFCFLFLFPYLRSGLAVEHNVYLLNYPFFEKAEALTRAQGDVLQTTGVMAASVLNRLSRVENFKFFNDLFGPLMFYPLFSPGALFPASPIFLQCFLSKSFQKVSIHYHYAATLAPFIFIAFVITLKKIYGFCGKLFFYMGFSTIAMLCVINTVSVVDPLVQEMPFLNNPKVYFSKRMMADIPHDAEVVASFRYLEELSQRKGVYAFFNVWRDRNYFTQSMRFELPPTVRLALVDFGEFWLNQEINRMPESTVPNLKRFFIKGGWAVQQAVGDVVLFEKNDENELRLVEISEEIFPEMEGRGPGFLFEGYFRLEYVQLGGLKRYKDIDLLEMTFFWKTEQQIPYDLIQVLLLKRQGRTLHDIKRPIGYGIYPTHFWQEGEFIKEKYWMPLPGELPEGRYSIEQFFISRNDYLCYFHLYCDTSLIPTYGKSKIAEFSVGDY